ncbi:uncharacterized protein [Temnothorax nylanderi]|uniref:uncharacterized protein n=1 Tax=Temnothorax nylanderi TaxID=102681 RepID=UPI003A899289
MSYIEAKRKVKGAKLSDDPRLDFVNFPNLNTTRSAPNSSADNVHLQNRFNLLVGENDIHSNSNSGGKPYTYANIIAKPLQTHTTSTRAYKGLAHPNRFSLLSLILAVLLITFPPHGRNSASAEIRILQWNSRGIQSKLPDLQQIAENYDVFCIQETLLTEGCHLGFQNYGCMDPIAQGYYRKRESGLPGQGSHYIG